MEYGIQGTCMSVLENHTPYYTRLHQRNPGVSGFVFTNTSNQLIDRRIIGELIECSLVTVNDFTYTESITIN